MKKLLLILAFLTAAPSYASDGTIPKLIFWGMNTVADQILWCPTATAQQYGAAFDFTPTNGDFTPSHYVKQGSSYAYNPPAPPPPPAPTANVLGLKAALITDSTIPIEAKLELYKFAAVVNDLAQINPAALQLIWSQIVAQEGGAGGLLNGNCTDGTPIISKVQALASANNIQLVAH